jgi:hypothetical protein
MGVEPMFGHAGEVPEIDLVLVQQAETEIVRARLR